MGGPRNAAYIWAIVVLALLAAASIVPTPYYLLAPGSAVALDERVVVGAHRPPARRFYLTDVTLARASLLLLAGRFLPGTQLVRREVVVPSGVSATSYDRVLVDAMDSSQNTAALVAERAAGYRVAIPPAQIEVASVVVDSHASGLIFPGDRIDRVGKRPIRTLQDVARIVSAAPPGKRIEVDGERDGRPFVASIETFDDGGTARLGIALRERRVAARLPVPVRYALGDIAGSSGGLMFALDIFASLRGIASGDPVAGTGTIAVDGSVGPIEGTRQKMIAAERAGARIFLVPQQNYAEIAGERGIAIVPVRTFADALRGIGFRAP